MNAKQFSYSQHHDLLNSRNKRRLNRRLFDLVAPRYDLITRLLSLGKDSTWKDELIKHAPQEAISCLDLASGTGDLSKLLQFRYPNSMVISLDLCETMLTIAKDRNQRINIHWIQSDMQALPFPNESLDIITGGYALRNAPDLNCALTMVYQKLKPGGWGGFLEFSHSNHPFICFFQLSILKIWAGLWGLLLHGNPSVYTYIPATLKLFPSLSELKTLLLTKGFHKVECKTYCAGVISLIWFRKPN